MNKIHANRLTVASKQSAGVFRNLRQRHLLLVLTRKEHSLSDLARVSEMPLNLLHHHIAKLLRLGLIRVSRQQARAGRPVKFYRAAALEFFVPAELAGSPPDSHLARQMTSALERNLASGFEGILYTHDGERPLMQIVRDPDQRAAACELWQNLHLTPVEARRLAAELKALFEVYGHKPRGGRSRYLAHAAFAATKD